MASVKSAITLKERMEKKRKRLFGETSWTSSPPAQEQVREHLASLASRALISQKLMEDRVGLSRAYAAPNNVYIRGTTAYVSGTQLTRNFEEAARDLFDDAKLPLVGARSSRRYEELQQALSRNPQVTHLVGHSLGGSVVEEMARQNKALTATTYGAPVVDVFARSSTSLPNRFANYGDPIAMFDTNATPGFNGNPHSFSNFANISTTDSSRGYENPDKTVTLSE
jgi:predicted DNA-binding WGR domain protein